MAAETSEHFLAKCDGYAVLRMDWMGDHPVQVIDIQHIGLCQLLEFIRSTGRFQQDVIQ